MVRSLADRTFQLRRSEPAHRPGRPGPRAAAAAAAGRAALGAARPLQGGAAAGEGLSERGGLSLVKL